MQVQDLMILITIASTTLYLIFRNLPFGAGSFAFVWAPITIIIILLNRPFSFTFGPMKILLLYGLVSVALLQFKLWSYMSDFNRLHIAWEFYNLFVITSILSYYISKGDLNRFALVGKWTFLFIIVTIIGTNVALFIDPTLIRNSANTDNFNDLQKGIFRLTGAMGYSYLQAIICLIPILIYHIKLKKKMVLSKNILIVILLLIIITEIRAQVFANILVTILITIMAIIGSKSKFRSLTIVILISFFLVTAPTSFFIDLFVSLSSFFPTDSILYNKITDFAAFLSNQDLESSTDTGNRANRYPMLLEALIANPFFGSASYKSNLYLQGGAHLYWMNKLAILGIPGFLFFIIVLSKIFKSIIVLLDPDFKFYYLISILAFVLLGLMKSIGGREVWLMLIVIIPSLYFHPLLSKREGE